MTSYPANIANTDGTVRIGGNIEYTGGATNEPLGPTLPVVVDASNLPTSDPSVAGQLYVDTGVVKVSAG